MDYVTNPNQSAASTVNQLVGPRPGQRGPQPYDTAAAVSEQLWISGQAPKIVGVAHGSQSLLIAWQGYEAGKPACVTLTRFMRVSGNPKGPYLTPAWDRELPLPLLVGMASDGTNTYVVSAVSEDLNLDVSVVTFRPNVLVMTKFDDAGKQVWQRDLNSSQFLGDAADKAVFSPLTAGTGAVSYGNGKVVVALASNTLPDMKIGRRHQRAQYLVVGADGSGFKAAEETSWRHSFDQRLLFDGQDFVFMDLADAGWYMPGAGVTLRKIKPTAGGATFVGGREGVYVYVRQGGTGNSENFSFTSLGDLQPGTRGYVALFSSERSNPTVVRDGNMVPVAEPRNLALVHVTKDFDTVKDGRWDANETLGNTIIQTVDGSPDPRRINVTSRVVDGPGPTLTFERPQQPQKTFTQTGIVWLTNLPAGVSAERPKLLKLADDRYIALWEEWTYSGRSLSYRTTRAMVVGESGQIIRPAVTIDARLNPSGADRLFAMDGRAAWIVGQGASSWKLSLHSIGLDLTLATLNVDLPQPMPPSPGPGLNPYYTGELQDPRNNTV